MTSKLKCAFCNKDLILSYITDDLCCEECWESATEKVWQALIQAKQDLEIARKALEEIKKHNKAMLSVLGEQIPKESTDTEEYCWWASCRIQDCLKALEQIEHKE